MFHQLWAPRAGGESFQIRECALFQYQRDLSSHRWRRQVEKRTCIHCIAVHCITLHSVSCMHGVRMLHTLRDITLHCFTIYIHNMKCHDRTRHDIHSSIHPFIHSFVLSFIRSFFHSFNHPTIHSFIHPFIHSFQSYTHACIHACIHTSVHTNIRTNE